MSDRIILLFMSFVLFYFCNKQKIQEKNTQKKSPEKDIKKLHQNCDCYVSL